MSTDPFLITNVMLQKQTVRNKITSMRQLTIYNNRPLLLTKMYALKTTDTKEMNWYKKLIIPYKTNNNVN